MSIVVDFFRGGNDHRGRTLVEIVSRSDQWLEETHDYIQWLFPTPTASQFNTNAPLVAPGDREAFVAEPTLRGTYLAGAHRMAQFYGFTVDEFADGTCRYDYTSDFEKRSANWLTNNNHNYLRLTRTLESMNALGFENYATALFQILDLTYQKYPTRIGETTYHFWRASGGA